MAVLDPTFDAVLFDQEVGFLATGELASVVLAETATIEGDGPRPRQPPGAE